MQTETLFTRPSEEEQLQFDITRNLHNENENSIEANESLPPGVKTEIEKAIFRYINKLERVGATCDEIEQAVTVNGKLISHQTASARFAQLKAERVIVQRFDGTPTEGRFKAKRATRSRRRAGVFICRKFADGFELGTAERYTPTNDKLTALLQALEARLVDVPAVGKVLMQSDLHDIFRGRA